MNFLGWQGTFVTSQSLKPIRDNLEMDETLNNVVNKLQSSSNYPNQFRKAFGTTQIDTILISKALEQFMNSIVSNHSKYDDYLTGAYTLTAQEERGAIYFLQNTTRAFLLQAVPTANTAMVVLILKMTSI